MPQALSRWKDSWGGFAASGWLVKDIVLYLLALKRLTRLSNILARMDVASPEGKTQDLIFVPLEQGDRLLDVLASRHLGMMPPEEVVQSLQQWMEGND